MHREEDEDVCQEAGHGGLDGLDGMGWGTGRCLRHLAVDPRPALVALTAELLLHVQDVVMVEVSTDVEAPPPGGGIMVDAEEEWVQVQVSARVEALADTAAILLAERLATQLGCRGDVDDIMSQLTIDELLHRQTVFLEDEEGFTRLRRPGNSPS